MISEKINVIERIKHLDSIIEESSRELQKKPHNSEEYHHYKTRLFNASYVRELYEHRLKEMEK